MFDVFIFLTSFFFFRVLANPDTPPALDWTEYKKRIPIAGMVDTFRKSYETLNIPYPVDNVTKLVEEQEKTVLAEVNDFKNKSESKIKT